MMGGINRLIAAAMVTLMCVGMWGCTEVTFEWYDERSKPLIAGFINDSFVVVTDCRGWYEDTETKWNSGYATETSCGHDRMMVYNYRVQEDGPRWSDSLTNKYDGKHWYQMTDSVFWRWNGDDILLWKVGEKAHEMRLSRKNDGCSQSFKVERIRQWLNGKFIALGETFSIGENICQYAVLDTIARTLIYKRLDQDLEWIKQCDDVRAWDNNVYCLALMNEPLDLFFFKNGKVIDSLLQGNPYGWAEYTKVGFAGNMLNLGNNVCEIVNDNFRCVGISIRNALEYKYKDGISVIY